MFEEEEEDEKKRNRLSTLEFKQCKIECNDDDNVDLLLIRIALLSIVQRSNLMRRFEGNNFRCRIFHLTLISLKHF